MGTLFIVFNVYPEEPGQEKEIQEKIKAVRIEHAKLQDLKVQPVAFGLQVIKAGFIMPDKTGGLQEKLEGELKKIANVREIEIATTTLL